MAEKRQRGLREMWSLTVTNKKKKKDAAGNNVMFSRRLPKQMPVHKWKRKQFKLRRRTRRSGSKVFCLDEEHGESDDSEAHDSGWEDDDDDSEDFSD